MKIVIQCAGSKRCDAGYFKSRDGRKIKFVADPDNAPKEKGIIHKHPDDLSDNGRTTWRDELLDYNKNPGDNPFGLLPAWQLYENSTYCELARKYGTDLYILSAGWGLISANFLTPMYDITFSCEGKEHAKRRKRNPTQYKDFSMLSSKTNEKIIFFVCSEYRNLARVCTQNANGYLHLFYKSKNTLKVPGFTCHSYKTKEALSK